MPDDATLSTNAVTDRECLEAWRRERRAEDLRPVVERYARLVYSSAYRRTGSAESAGEVTRAVFLVLARRARKFLGRTVLAGWLFGVTRLACRKVMRRGRWSAWKRWFRKRPRTEIAADAPLWTRVAPKLDRCLDRLSTAQRNAVLLRVFLNQGLETAAGTLRTTEQRVGKRVERGLKRLGLRWRGVTTDWEALGQACSTEGCALAPPEELVAGILESIEASRGKRPVFKLARRVLRSLAWRRWFRRYVIANAVLIPLLAVIGGVAWHISSLTGHSRFISTLVVWSARWQMRWIAEPARPWPTNSAAPRLDARQVRSAQELYRTTNIWLAHLNFTREHWKALEPRRFAPLPNFRRADGFIELRNSKAQRNGLAGVFGYEFAWTHADFEFGNVAFSNVAVRLKGNMRSLVGTKQAFKVDLNGFVKGQKFHGLDELTLDDLCWDYSCVGDALGYEFFRDAGVPAPRTAYAWFCVSVEKQWDRRPIGLYLMVEPVDEAFVAERFGSKKTPVFKPVTYKLFDYLGNDWPAYAGIYDLKTKATPAQLQRVMDFARLVSLASDAQFAARVGDFLDLDEFGRFLAVEVLLSNYDSPLTDGQNFYMYIDPRSDKFGFIPWDLDACWGGWFWIASRGELERASIWHPWVGENKLLERLMGVEEFRRIYRAHLKDFLERLLVPERLHRRIDEMAELLREPIGAESRFRLSKFEQSVGKKPIEPGSEKWIISYPAHDLKGFIQRRAKFVRLQLDGKSAGMILKPPGQR